MRKLIIALVLFAGCDLSNEIPFDEPGWVGDWTGEMYNDLDLDNVNGPLGRVDSLDISFFWDGDMGFEASGVWTFRRPLFDDYLFSVHAHVTIWDTNDLGQEWMQFLANVGDGVETIGEFKFNCWTNGEEAGPGQLTCRRLRSALDSWSPDITPPKFEIFYLQRIDS